MKTLLPLLGAATLLSLLSACGTGLLPAVSRDLPDINVTLPTATSANPVVVYMKDNQFAGLPPLAGSVSSVSLQGTLLYTGTGTLSGVGVYVRQDTVGCVDGGSYFACTGDESANKLTALSIVKGEPQAVMLSGAPLNKAVQARQGYFGFLVTGGNSVNGDKISVTKVKASIQF